MKLDWLKRMGIGFLVGLVAAGFVWLLGYVWPVSGFLERFELATYDWRTVISTNPPQNPIEDIVIIDIDERSIQKLGKFHQWPRTYWAQVISYVCEGNPRLIGLDVLFDRDLRHPSEDMALVDSVRACGKVFGAFLFSQADSSRFRYPMSAEPANFPVNRFRADFPEELMYQIPSFDRMEAEFIAYLDACQGVGFANIPADPDGIFRRIPLYARFNEHVYPAFSMAIVSNVLGVESIRFDPGSGRLILHSAEGQVAAIPIDQHGQMLIKYQGPYGTFRYISFYDALMKFVPREYFANRIVLFGSSATALFDLKPTPIQPIFPGVEVNANIIYQLLHGQFLHSWQFWQKLLYLFLLGGVAGSLFALLRPLGGIMLAFLLMLVLLVASLYLLSSEATWVPLAQPLLAVVFAFAANYAFRYLHEEKDKRQLKQIFSRYVSPAVVEEILKDPSRIKLGGEKRICSVLFSDLEGFTSLSEKNDPEDLVRILNEYLTEMTGIILEQAGTLDKYEGDAIMAIFGAPIEQPDHALRACRAALKMQQRLRVLRQQKAQQGFPALRQRIGINSGEMIVGNMGSAVRFDYTAIGDAVNLAARLESANKVYGTEIIISEYTRELVQDFAVTRLLDLVRVKGRQKPVKIFELISLKEEPMDGKLREKIAFFEQGIQYYLARNWEWAMNQFRQVLQIDPEDAPARLYLLRCQELLENPPGPNWDGVFSIRSK